MSRAVPSKPVDRRKLIIYATLALIVIAVAVAFGITNNNSNAVSTASQAPIHSSVKVGQTAPEFSVQTDAGPFNLASVSTPVLLEVFATWCPHCQHETRVLNDIAGSFAGKIAIVAVSGSPMNMTYQGAESQADVNEFGATFGVRYPLAFDPNLTVAHEYLQSGYPTLVLIDKQKKIRWMKDGEVPETDIVKAIETVI